MLSRRHPRLGSELAQFTFWEMKIKQKRRRYDWWTFLTLQNSRGISDFRFFLYLHIRVRRCPLSARSSLMKSHWWAIEDDRWRCNPTTMDSPRWWFDHRSSGLWNDWYSHHSSQLKRKFNISKVFSSHRRIIIQSARPAILWFGLVIDLMGHWRWCLNRIILVHLSIMRWWLVFR